MAGIVCVLATYDKAGIHAVPMWFAKDGDALVLATGAASRKVRNLERDPVPRSCCTTHAPASRSVASRWQARRRSCAGSTLRD